MLVWVIEDVGRLYFMVLTCSVGKDASRIFCFLRVSFEEIGFPSEFPVPFTVTTSKGHPTTLRSVGMMIMIMISH